MVVTLLFSSEYMSNILPQNASWVSHNVRASFAFWVGSFVAILFLF